MPAQPLQIPRRHLLPLVLFQLQAAQNIEVPVLLVTDKHAHWTDTKLKEFRANVWDEAVREFSASGVTLKIEERIGEVVKYPGGRPRFIGLDPQRLNVVITDHVPLSWDRARFSAGVSRTYEGHHIALLSVGAAHPNRVPLLALNSAVHELLHVFLGDIFASRETLRGYDREARVDWYATRLWLSKDVSAVRTAADSYVRRLLAKSASQQ